MGSAVAIRLKGKHFIGSSTETKRALALATSNLSIDLDIHWIGQCENVYRMLSAYASPNSHKNDHGTKCMTACDEFDSHHDNVSLTLPIYKSSPCFIAPFSFLRTSLYFDHFVTDK